MEKQEKKGEPMVEKKETDRTAQAKRKTTGAKKAPFKLDTDSDEVPCVPPGTKTKRDRFDNRKYVLDLLEEKVLRSSPSHSEAEDDICYPALIQFMRTLTDEQWTLIRQNMMDSAGKAKLMKMCQRIVKVISEMVFRLLVPALLLELEDSGSGSASDTARQEEAAGSTQKELDDLTKEYSYLKREAGASAASSKSSQGSVMKTSIQDYLKTIFGITEDSVMESLTASSTSSSPELTRAMVGEVVHELNAGISVVVAHSPSSSSLPVTGCSQMVTQATKNMVRVIHDFFQMCGITGKPVPKTETAPSEAEKDLEILLAPMTSEVMTAIADSIESVQGSGQGVAVLLRELEHKVHVISSRSSDVLGSSKKGVPPKAMIDAGINMEVLSSSDFRRNASRAVSEVLRRQSSSGCSQHDNVTSSQTDMLGTLTPLPASLSLVQAESADSVILQSFVQDMEAVAHPVTSSTPFPKPTTSVVSLADKTTPEAAVDAEASKIIETFVSDVKEIAEAIEAHDSRGQVNADQLITTESDAAQAGHSDFPAGQPSRRQWIFSATWRLYQNIQEKLAFFRRGSVTGKKNQTPRQEEEPVKNVKPGLLSDYQSSMTELDDSTRDVLAEIVTTYKTEVIKLKSSTSIVSRSSETLATGLLVNNIITQLEGFIRSRSPSPTEAVTAPQGSYKPLCASSQVPSCAGSNEPSHTSSLSLSPQLDLKLRSRESLPIESLSSAQFHSKATAAVCEVLLRSSVEFDTFMSSSHYSLQSTTEPAPTSLAVESEASEIVDTFVSDIRCISESAGPLASKDKSISFPVALKLVERLQAKLRGFYSRLMVLRTIKEPDNVPPQGNEHQEQAAQPLTHPSPEVSKSQPVLAKIWSSEEVIPRRGQSESSPTMAALTTPEISQILLDTTTKEVVRSIVDLHSSEVSQEQWSLLVQNRSDESLAVSECVKHMMACLEDISSPRSSTHSLSFSPEAILRDLSCEEFHSKGSQQVKGVLAKSISTTAKSTDSAALDIFSTTVSSIKDIFQTIGSTGVFRPTNSVFLQGSSRGSEVSVCSSQSAEVTVPEVILWSASQTIYQTLQRKLRNFITLQKQAFTKSRAASWAEAKKSLSQILIAVEEETRTSEDLLQLHGLVGAMIDHLDEVKFDEDKEPQRPASAKSSTSKGSSSEKALEDTAFSLPGTPTPHEVPVNISPIVRSTMIDTTEATEAKVSPLDRTRQIMLHVVNIIMDHVDPLVLQQQHTSGVDPDTDFWRLEELTTQGRIRDLSRDIIDQLHREISGQRSAFLTGSLAAGRSVSDTGGEGVEFRKRFASELVYSFAEESVRRLLIPLLLPFSSWRPDQKDPKDGTSSSQRSPPMDTLSRGSEPRVELELMALQTDTQSGGCLPHLGHMLNIAGHKKVEGGSVQSAAERPAPASEVRKKETGRFLFNFKCQKKEVQSSEAATVHAKKNKMSIEEQYCIPPRLVAQKDGKQGLPSSSQPQRKPAKRSSLRIFSPINKTPVQALPGNLKEPQEAVDSSTH